MDSSFRMGNWAKENEEVWRKVVAKYGGDVAAFSYGTWDFVDWALGKAWSTVGSVSKARKFGWTRYDDTYDTYVETFRAFENVGILPSSDTWNGPKTPERTTELAPNPRTAALARREKTKALQADS